MEETIIKEILDDFIPVFAMFSGTENYSIALGGSWGKGTADKNSDIDFRLYYEKAAPKEVRREAYSKMNRLIEEWSKRGITVEQVWPRTYDEIDSQLEMWIEGNGKAEDFIWTLWGYQILTDIYHSKVVVDTNGKYQSWKNMLELYPAKLKDSIIKKHMESLTYWRNDYHYKSKVNRKDIVFLASINARLLQDILQILYALNEVYYPGDGANLKYTEQFTYKPNDFEKRVEEIFFVSDESGLEMQYVKMVQLIDDVLEYAGTSTKDIGSTDI